MNTETIELAPQCRRCHVTMNFGEAIQNGLATLNGQLGLFDQTVSPNPRIINVVPVWKCLRCGHSITRKI